MKKLLIIASIVGLFAVGNAKADEAQLSLTWEVNVATDNVKMYILQRLTSLSPGIWLDYVRLCEDPEDHAQCQNAEPADMNDPEDMILLDTIPEGSGTFSYRLWAENLFGRSLTPSNTVIISTLVPEAVKGLRIRSLIVVPTFE